jgi:hypothetical protein
MHPFTENNLHRLTAFVERLCNLLCPLDDHEVTSFNAPKGGRLGPFKWADRWGEMINAH